MGSGGRSARDPATPSDHFAPEPSWSDRARKWWTADPGGARNTLRHPQRVYGRGPRAITTGGPQWREAIRTEQQL